MANRELLEALARGMTPEMKQFFAKALKSRFRPAEPPAPGPEWWQKPGLGIMYQTEYRPGWHWNRDFEAFNRSMKGPDGKLAFNGPFCRVEDWVRASAAAGVDYHIMEIKWHDGICYFDTSLTEWKTPVDYALQFAEASRKAGIPFLYYYSSIFDHNPQFDPIQPSRRTASFIGIPPKAEYEEYIKGQYREIMERYRPDGMWIDWYWPDGPTEATIRFFRETYPEVVLAFNAANLQPGSYSRLDYTSGEGHDLDGPYLKILKEETGTMAVFSSTWKWASLNRRMFTHRWELISPAGRWWEDPRTRDDPYDLPRMAAVTMACGGLHCTGVAAQMDGSLYAEQAEQLEILGAWYRPRKSLFSGSAPLPYGSAKPPGVNVTPSSVRPIACVSGGDRILHLVNMDGATRPISVELRGRSWRAVDSAWLEPEGAPLELKKTKAGFSLSIAKRQVDPVDTIVRLSGRFWRH